MRLFKNKKYKKLYPFRAKKLLVNYQGFPEIKVKKDCIECKKCQELCPTETIKISKIDGEVVASYNKADCVVCFICRELCPKRRIHVINDFEFAEFDKNDLIWDSSKHKETIK